MNKILYAFLTMASLASCAGSYDIHGSSNMSMLDDKKLYLKVFSGNDMKNIDSCDVVHGKFFFKGSLDSIRLATLFMDEESLLPVVLENGEISVKIDDNLQMASGTPLNDRLAEFLKEYTKLSNEFNELGRKQSQAIMNGEDESEINVRLNQEAARLIDEEDKLVTGFITENFDNVLGPGVFFMLTAGNRIPELSPWIEDIMSKATENFKNDAYVKQYYKAAKQNEALMNGTAEPAQMPPPANAPLPQTPTPNQLAAPTDSAH